MIEVEVTVVVAPGGQDVVTSFAGHMARGVLTGILYGYVHSGGGSDLAF